MSPAAYQSFLVIALGFCLSGLLTSGYQILMFRPASFRVLGTGFGRITFWATPFVMFAAPFILLRNVLRNGARGRGRPRDRFVSALVAAVASGVWSLLSGSVVVTGLKTLGVIVA